MGRFDYPSPYCDSVGDPALDLIDRMLTVDADKRITVDECLEHPWITEKYLNPADSTDGLTGAMGQLDFSRRKMERERTLLSTINEVKVNTIIESKDNAEDPPVKVFDKNPAGKRAHKAPASNGRAGKGKKKREETPAANRGTEEFMEMGGKGDLPLFGDDTASRYEPDEVL
jgi:serine/threonine-protein kinase Chk2